MTSPIKWVIGATSALLRLSFVFTDWFRHRHTSYRSCTNSSSDQVLVSVLPLKIPGERKPPSSYRIQSKAVDTATLVFTKALVTGFFFFLTRSNGKWKSLRSEKRGFTTLNIKQARQPSENRLFESCVYMTCRFSAFNRLRSVFSGSVFQYIFRRNTLSFNRFPKEVFEAARPLPLTDMKKTFLQILCVITQRSPFFFFGRGHRVDAMGCPYKADLKIGLKGSFEPKLSVGAARMEPEKVRRMGADKQKVYSMRILVL